MIDSFPDQLGYHMPAEWEPHEATWLSWPHNPETWPGKMEPIPTIWAHMLAGLLPNEKVHLNVNDAAMEKEVKTFLKGKKIPITNLIFHRFPTNDCWIRDCGPIFVTRKVKGKSEIAAIDWIFNKWGGKYPPWELDNDLPKKIADEFKIPRVEPGIVMEGGSLEVNGAGTLLTTESCLLNRNRNPRLTKKEIEIYLKKFLGVTNVLWLGQGIVGDDTDGHIDDIARFVNPTTVVTAIEEDPRDENYKILKDNLRRLEKMKDQDGKKLTIIPLPMPGAVTYENQRLPASYANFYIANNVVLFPTYDHHNDAIAKETLRKLFPGRKIVGINSIDLIWGLGAFHCITQQQPAIG